MSERARICWPWSLCHLETFDQHPRGGMCGACQRDIASPQAYRGPCICVACAADLNGLPEDSPLDGKPLGYLSVFAPRVRTG